MQKPDTPPPNQVMKQGRESKLIIMANKKVSKLPNPLAAATFYVGGKKVKEGRFFKAVADELNPPKKRIPKKLPERKFTLDEMKDIFRAGANYALNQFNEPNIYEYFSEKFGIDLGERK